ncbi:MAG: tetratricopeptide repeat protein [Cyanobacteria bacterium J06621_3]
MTEASEQISRNWDAQNEEALRKLILTVEANSQSLELLIAVCDDRNLQARMIEQYEAALREEGIAPFRVRLNPKEPSMRRSVAALVAAEPRLHSGEPAVVTVLNVEALLGVTLGEEKSEAERFFFSLQWTREALLRFEFAVVLWVPDRIATEIGRRAPDFWSWRGGVFEFVAEAGTGNENAAQSVDSVSLDRRENQQSERSAEELLGQVKALEETAPESALLITLYNDLGEVYEGRYEYGEALVWCEKALALSERKENLQGQARSLGNIGDSLRFSGRPADSIRYYQQQLEIVRKTGDRRDEAASLGNLGNAYHSLGQYQRAIDFQQQSLEMKREIGDRSGEAASLGNLGITNRNLGQYQRAIDFYQQQLEIAQEIGDRSGEAASLGNLGIAYRTLGQYQRAIDFQQRSLEMKREIGDRRGEANSLGNLGNTYNSLGQYRRAIDFHQQSLEMKREIGDRRGEANSLGGLGIAYRNLGQYQHAIDCHQQSLEIKREIGDRRGEANSLGNLGIAYMNLGQYQHAIDFYQQSLEIAHEIGDRRGKANSQFNTGLSLVKLNQEEAAHAAFKEARQLYASMDLSAMVERCDTKLNSLAESA